MKCKDCYHFSACSWWNPHLKEEADCNRNCPDFIQKERVHIITDEMVKEWFNILTEKLSKVLCGGGSQNENSKIES